MKKNTIPWGYIKERLPYELHGPTALAKALGLDDRNVVGNWKLRGAPIHQASKLAKLMGVPTDELLEIAEGVNSGIRGQKPPLSGEARDLILFVARLDSAGDLARKTFAATQGLLALSEAATHIEDRTREPEQPEQEVIGLLHKILDQYEGNADEPERKTAG